LIDIASCSKAFTATAFGLLIDDFIHGRNATPLPNGLTKLTWDTKVKDLLPSDEWNLMDSWAEEKASVRDILSHVSGFPRYAVKLMINLLPFSNTPSQTRLCLSA
jgi:CubicO group peptidase (beta-lactamase class C family)